MRRVLLLVAAALWLGAGVNSAALAAETQGQVMHNQLYLVAPDGSRQLAPDGRYPTRKGKPIVVKNGKILGGHPDSPRVGLLLPAVQKFRSQQKKPENPGTLRGFNPQPEPPAKAAPHQ